MSMLLYNLGKRPWAETQLIYHALARLGREAVVLVSPAQPYACIGFHQDMEQELDLAYCTQNNIPVFRREVGGGPVYLDEGQLFWQLILHRDNPLISFNRLKFYEKFLQPAISAYREAGVDARFRPVNDIVAGNQKISGTGAGEIGDSVVFVGNVIRSFDCATMVRVLKMPDEAFRSRVLASMRTNMSSLEGELGVRAANAVSDEQINLALAKGFQEQLGPLKTGEYDPELKAELLRLERKMLSPEWLRFARKPRPGRSVKLRADVFEHNAGLQTPQGLVQASYRLEEGALQSVELSGPAPAGLAARLEGLSLKDAAAVLDGQIPPGVSRKDWLGLLGIKPLMLD